ncbi:competence protein ComK [Neobacillus mesonae]|uniref:competence protein ComK n=1 Tax=Neobacillus mesonae TaxID=1193713 RepID=UPI002041A8A1|nr:competence protein ComK [Neobacillus mesonae]MCM3569338.1 competence protein ComK [Neobacillus mesonae]
MLIHKSYSIENTMIMLMKEYDQNGKRCSRVVEGRTAFLVDLSPIQLLDANLRAIGYDLKGAVNGSKFILGQTMMCPIIVNPYLKICLFPTKSPKSEDCIWFNPDHIVKPTAIGSKTQVELSNGYCLTVNLRLPSFKAKMHTAEKLMRLSEERGTHPGTTYFYLKPPKDHQLIKEKSGKYNFKALEKEEK